LQGRALEFAVPANELLSRSYRGVNGHLANHPGGEESKFQVLNREACPVDPSGSGGPLYDGTKALGITSGGSGDCKSGGTTFYQPVREAANAYGVTVY
jgi:Trypsin